MKYSLAVCGGTFDHFHKGHREFLRYALSISKKLLVGLTSDNYVKAKDKFDCVEEFRTRINSLENFFIHEKVSDRVSIELIDDIFIPKIWENLPIETIVVTKNTIMGARKINLRIKEQGKCPLKIEVAPLVKDHNNEYISSSRIRKGEINREGKPYINPYWLNHDLTITEKLRLEFKKPFGELFTEINNAFKNRNSLVIPVGDITTKIFNENSLGQKISVIDFKVAREKKFSNILELGFVGDENVLKVDNPPGHITSDLFRELAKIFKSEIKDKVVLQINGEEDLAVLPLILVAPLETVIFYGQPNAGIVKVKVSEENKDKAYGLMSQFVEY